MCIVEYTSSRGNCPPVKIGQSCLQQKRTYVQYTIRLTEGDAVTHVVSLTENDLQRLRAIVLDSDAVDALVFVKERILKQLEESMRKAMDTSKGHL